MITEHRIDARPDMITPGGNRACICGHVLSPGERPEAHTEVAAHPVYQHRDGSKCIWLDDFGWFVPYDVGGEGVECDNPEHETQRKFYTKEF